MTIPDYKPLFFLTRGDTVESVHYGSIAVVNKEGELLAHAGDPGAVTFLRSTAKPFQLLPFLAEGGQSYYQLEPQEIALMSASHSGSDEHFAVLSALQSKIGVGEADLLCGVHRPYDEITNEAMRARGEEPTPNRHNCSGKHTGMLAYARMMGWPTSDYINPDHPVQQSILKTFAMMCDLDVDQVRLGTDGCSAPNFAVPMRNAALAYARLAGPSGLPDPIAAACRLITASMTSHPVMVGGIGRFDTRLMQETGGRMVAKGGAEGYQGIGLLSGAIRPESPALGVTLKISDGDPKGRARPAVVLEVLRQLDALPPSELKALEEFGPTLPVYNWRKLVVGKARPDFQLL